MYSSPHSYVVLDPIDKLEGNHLLLTGPKKKRNGEESFVILMFIANNSIFKLII